MEFQEEVDHMTGWLDAAVNRAQAHMEHPQCGAASAIPLDIGPRRFLAEYSYRRKIPFGIIA
jgi:hypothetical protein